MKKLSRTFTALLFSFLLSSPAVLADRRHHDVEDIGNRDINGRILGIFPNFVSLQREVELGARLAQMLEETMRLVEDPVVNQYIDNLGQHIVTRSDAKVSFVIKVIDSDEVNGFALPGGYFYVNKGLILAAETEAELAGVMAHEIAHVTARHATERMTKGQLMQYAAIPAILVGGYWAQFGIQNGLGLGLDLAVLGITRKSEEEADQLGTQYLWNAGYDPDGFISFFQKLQALEKEKPGKFASFWRTHPPVDSRIEKVTDEISQLPSKEEYRITTSTLDDVKSRLVALDYALIINNGSQGSDAPKRPALKRKTGGDREEREKSTLRRDGEDSVVPELP